MPDAVSHANNSGATPPASRGPAAAAGWLAAPVRQPWLVVAALTALALLLPTANPTLDAWYYAACVRWRHDLFMPHHLLYNLVGVGWVDLLPAGTDVRAALNALNALLYGGILLALRPVLRAAGAPVALVAPWLWVVGSCFGLLRFATENEAYLAPLLLSMLASGAWVRWAVRAPDFLADGASDGASDGAAGRLPDGGAYWWLALAGALAAGACLLHQLHVWWWLALGVGTWLGQPLRWRAALTYAAPALLVPLAYGWAAHAAGFALTPRGLTDFVFHDYVITGNTPTPGLKALAITFINLGRTLGQVHGLLYGLLLRWPALAVVPVVVAGLLWRARGAWRGRRAATTAAQTRILRTHALAFGLHLAFAAVNDGNAEFMVMLPVLGAVLAVGWGQWRPAALGWFGAALLLWNLVFGLLPNHLLRLNASAALAARVRATPTATWLLTDQHLTENLLTYQTGQFAWPNLRADPSVSVQRAGGDARPFRRWLLTELAAGRPVYTDALSPPRPLDRARLTQPNRTAELLRGVQLARPDTLRTAFGVRIVGQLRLRPAIDTRIGTGTDPDARTSTADALRQDSSGLREPLKNQR